MLAANWSEQALLLMLRKALAEAAEGTTLCRLMLQEVAKDRGSRTNRPPVLLKVLSAHLDLAVSASTKDTGTLLAQMLLQGNKRNLTATAFWTWNGSVRAVAPLMLWKLAPKKRGALI